MLKSLSSDEGLSFFSLFSPLPSSVPSVLKRYSLFSLLATSAQAFAKHIHTKIWKLKTRIIIKFYLQYLLWWLLKYSPLWDFCGGTIALLWLLRLLKGGAGWPGEFSGYEAARWGQDCRLWSQADRAQSYFYYLSAMWPWSSYLISLGLIFFYL